MQTLQGIGTTAAATSHAFMWLWGSLAVVVFGVYMAVYLLVRTKWGHKTSLEAPSVVPAPVVPSELMPLGSRLCVALPSAPIVGKKDDRASATTWWASR